MNLNSIDTNGGKIVDVKTEIIPKQPLLCALLWRYDCRFNLNTDLNVDLNADLSKDLGTYLEANFNADLERNIEGDFNMKIIGTSVLQST